VKYLLCVVFSFVQPVAQQYKSTTVSSHYENYMKESHHMPAPNPNYFTKMNGTQRKRLVSPKIMYCAYCSMP